jgi:hypothetical protein
MNLDLGGTIWLNVTRKLLSYHKWFFTPLDSLPKRIMEEFKHHSHTHANTTTITSSTTTHAHDLSANLTNCGYSGASVHLHFFDLDLRDSHSHNWIFSFGSANLGSPWYVHTHTVAKVSETSAGAFHTHIIASPTSSNVCSKCVGYGHSHTTTLTTDSKGGSHTHGISAKVTGNADSGATPESHTHTFSFTVSSGNVHYHAVGGGSFAAALCYRSKNHTHAIPDTDNMAHDHSISGTSGDGGESAAIAEFQGDGLTFIS